MKTKKVSYLPVWLMVVQLLLVQMNTDYRQVKVAQYLHQKVVRSTLSTPKGGADKAYFKSNQINAGFSQEDNQNWM